VNTHTCVHTHTHQHTNTHPRNIEERTNEYVPPMLALECLVSTLDPVPLRAMRGDGAVGAVSKIVSKWKIITVTTAYTF
jgi:hypothetical protein